jgi:hypothetical protein
VSNGCKRLIFADDWDASGQETARAGVKSRAHERYTFEKITDRALGGDA